MLLGFRILLAESLNAANRMPFYAVAKGRQPGVYQSWDHCESQVKHFKGAKYKKFSSCREAEDFISKTTGISITSKLNEQIKTSEAGTSTSTTSNSDVKEALSDSTVLDVLASLDRFVSKTDVQGENRKRKYLNISKTAESPVGEPREYTFDEDSAGYVIVHTDGSCINNGQKTPSAGYGVYFGENHPLNASEPVKHRATNNCGEIQAASHAIRVAYKVGIKKLAINTDSMFLIKAITEWVPRWKKNNWMLPNRRPVKNTIDFKELDELLNDSDIQVKWNYVKAHNGDPGNEAADRAAKEGAAIFKANHKI